jgi:hypothetical protein
MKLNHEFFNEDRTNRILSEQISLSRGGVKTIGIVSNVDTRGNPFNFESYHKVIGDKTFTLLHPEKIMAIQSVNKEDFTGNKWTNPTTTFQLDEIFHMKNALGFFNYDNKLGLYSELEVMLELGLYQNPDNILQKFSFNRPEILHLLNYNRLKTHFNIASNETIEDPFFIPNKEEEIDTKSIFKIISKDANIVDNKVRIPSIILIKLDYYYVHGCQRPWNCFFPLPTYQEQSPQIRKPIYSGSISENPC